MVPLSWVGVVICWCKLKVWKRAMKGLLLDGKNGMLNSPCMIVDYVILDKRLYNSSVKGASKGASGLQKRVVLIIRK